MSFGLTRALALIALSYVWLGIGHPQEVAWNEYELEATRQLADKGSHLAQ